MTRTGFIAFTILLFLFLGGGYTLGVLFPFVQEKSSVTVAQSDIATSTTEVLVEDLSHETDYAIVHAEVPQFPSLPSDFNTKIRTLADTAIKEHLESSVLNWKARSETSDGTIPSTPLPGERFPFFVSWEAKQVNPRFVSILVRYGGFNGGAHGYEAIATFNYDLTQKKEVELADLLPGNPDYLGFVASTSIASLEASIPDMMRTELDDSLRASIKDGAAPTLQNYARYTFTDDVITIYFSQYQVGPYVIGMPTVTIPRKP